MTHELSEIKKIRKTLGLTQTDLAKRAAVSQSLIAKIESNKIDPTYTKTKKIFDTLNDLENKEEIKAEELMNKKIIRYPQKKFARNCREFLNYQKFS